MLMNATDAEQAQLEAIEVAVVGAGAVGLCLAVQLARKGRRVALLEAGPAGADDESQSLFRRAVATGHPLPGLHVGRFRCLGGTTNFWGGQLVPFSQVVFAERPWVGDHAWPISYGDIAPYYRTAMDLLGLKDVIQNDDAIWDRLGVDRPKRTDLIDPIFTRWTPESNLAVHFRHDILYNPNLVVLLGAQVGALKVDDRGEVEGVEIRFRDRPARFLNAPSVVLANGTIEISRLLQFPDHMGRPAPWSTNTWVGRGFMDHVDCFAGAVEPIDKRRFSDMFDNVFIDGLKYNPKLKLRDSAQIDRRLLDISSHFVFNSSVSEHIANLKILAKGLLKGRLDQRAITHPLALLKSLRFVVPLALRYIRYRRITNFSDGGIQLRLTAEQKPLPTSSIRLSDELDDFGLPVVNVNWQIDPEDIRSISTFAGFVKDYLEAEGIARVHLDPRLVEADPAFIAEIDDANHQMGGARMATDASRGVVDRDCAVFGTKNLYIAGAAVYPSSGFANPTFTAIALGLRLADHLENLRMGDAHASAA